MSNQLIHPGYISSDGSTSGQVLTSNGTYVSWQSVSATINAAATYSFTNTVNITGGAAATTGTGAFSVSNTIIFIGNNATNSTLTATALSVVAGANTTGTGGAYLTGTSLSLGNNTANAVINTTGVYVGGTSVSGSSNTTINKRAFGYAAIFGV